MQRERHWPSWKWGTPFRYYFLIAILVITTVAIRKHQPGLVAYPLVGAGLGALCLGMGAGMAYDSTPGVRGHEATLGSIWGLELGAFLGTLGGLALWLFVPEIRSL